MAKIGYVDAGQLPDRGGFEPLPAGTYQAVIVDSIMENTKANDGGQFLKLEMRIIGGEFDGKTIFDRLNLVNKNATAVKIAQGTLKEIILAQGKVAISDDSSELHGVPMLIEVHVTPPKGNFGPGNEIKKYLPVQQYAPAAPQQQQYAAPAPQPAGNVTHYPQQHAPAAAPNGQYSPQPAPSQGNGYAPIASHSNAPAMIQPQQSAPVAPNAAPQPHAPVGGSPPPWKRKA